jgi:Flp pilus assembly protein TadG
MKATRAARPSPSQARRGTPHRQPLGDFWRRQSGGLAIYAALSLPVVAGMVGVGLDMSVWYALKRDVQGMADAGAIGAAQTLLSGGTESEASTAALADATINRYDDSVAGNALTLAYNQSVTGSKTETVQATARVRAPLHFASFFVDEVFVSAFAAAGYQSLGTQCVLALHPTASGAVTFDGNTTADVGCGVQSNSDHPTSSILVTGQATLTANPVQAYGQIGIEGGGQVVSDYPLMPNSPLVNDPYSSFASSMPSKSTTCITPGVTVEPFEDITFGPCVPGGAMTFDGTVRIKGTATFEPGVYYIDNGDMYIAANASLTAIDVTFVLTGDDASDVGNFEIAGQADVVIEAPDSGTYAGMAVVQDPIADSIGDNVFVGGAGQQIDGVLYFPNQHVEFAGGNDAVDGCVQIIASTVDFTGTSYIENDPDVCAAAGVASGGIGGGLIAVLTR